MCYLTIKTLLVFSQLIPRCWVGVVDQINPPWIKVIGEQGETLELPLDRVYKSVREGHWVIYWSRTKRLEHLDSEESRREIKLQKDLLHHLLP